MGFTFLRYLVQGRRRKRSQSAEDAQTGFESLRSVTLRRVSPAHQSSLPEQGWTTITYETPLDLLESSALELLEAGKAFFDLPVSAKEAFNSSQGTEEGWNRVEGEKEFITLRYLSHTPEILRDPGVAFWSEACSWMNELLRQVATSLDISPQMLTRLSDPCATLRDEQTATMLRLFRYEGSEADSKIVAEAHHDLGLLSLVISDTPGLEVWDRHDQAWFPLEMNYPSGSLLVGRQLEALTNGRYHAGGHLVRLYQDAKSEETTRSLTPKTKYRYSIVLVLRAHSPMVIDTEKMTTKITGPFNTPVNSTAGELYNNIHKMHFNINAGISERTKQKQNLENIELSSSR